MPGRTRTWLTPSPGSSTTLWGNRAMLSTRPDCSTKVQANRDFARFQGNLVFGGLQHQNGKAVEGAASATPTGRAAAGTGIGRASARTGVGRALAGIGISRASVSTGIGPAANATSSHNSISPTGRTYSLNQNNRPDLARANPGILQHRGHCIA